MRNSNERPMVEFNVKDKISTSVTLALAGALDLFKRAKATGNLEEYIEAYKILKENNIEIKICR